MHDCLFCRIVRGEIPAAKVFEDDLVLAFKDIQPQRPVHVLVIPKKHINSLLTLADNGLLLEIFAIIKQVAAQVVAEHGACRVITNIGNYQDSKHLHWHVIFGSPLRSTDLTNREEK